MIFDHQIFCKIILSYNIIFKLPESVILLYLMRMIKINMFKRYLVSRIDK